MVELSPDDQQLLVELLAGDRSPDEPAVAARLAAHPELRAEFEALRAIEQRVEAVAQRERTLVAAGTIPPSAASPARRGPVAARHSRRWLLVGLAAAAALVGSYFVFREPAAVFRDDQRTLGGQLLELVVPPSLADGPLRLRWKVAPQLQQARFDASIIDPAAPLQLPVLERRGLHANETEWNLTPQETSKLRPGLLWRVEAVLGGRTIEREITLR